MRILYFLNMFVWVIIVCLFGVNDARAQEKLAVRGGDHDGYSRIVFDWNNTPTYKIQKSESKLVITFNKMADVDLGAVSSSLRNIKNVEFKKDGGESLTFTMTIPDDSKFRDFAVSQKIVVDVYDGARPALQEATPKTPTQPQPKETKLETITPAKETKNKEEEADFSVEQGKADITIPTPDVVAAPIPPPKIEDHEITLTTLTNVGLGVYQRHGDLWIVTDSPQIETPPKIEGPQKDKFESFEKTEMKDGDVYRISLPDGVVASAQGGGLAWKILLTQRDDKKSPSNTVSPTRVADSDHEKLLWPIKGAQKIIQFKDPFAGDDVYVVTSNSASTSSGASRNYVDFTTLDALVGLAFVGKREDVQAKIEADGVSISRDGGLVLSNTDALKTENIRKEVEDAKKEIETQNALTPSIEPAKEENPDIKDLTLTENPPSGEESKALQKEIGLDNVKVDEVGESHEPPKTPNTEKVDTAEIAKAAKEKPVGNNIYNFPRWELGGVKSLDSNMRALMAEVAAKPEIERTEDVITMAKLLIANNHAHEALGMLRIALQQVPELEKSNEFQALRGAALALSGKFDEAIEEFSSDELKGYDDIKLWRAYTLAGLEDWKQAGALVPSNVSMLAKYPSPIRYPFALALAEIDLRNARAKEAVIILDVLKPDLKTLPLSYKSAWDYLSGEAQRQIGNTKKADEYWTPLVKNGKDDLYRAKAGLSLTRLQLDNKTLKPADAIDRLESLRYAWRGDELETLINYRLGQLYIENKDYLKGLTVLRNASILTPELAIGDDVKKLMMNTFQDVFLKNHLAEMSPIEAISLYEEFKDLTPPNEEGEAYVEKLAERLVDADLLGRAASLLEYQVNNNLKGNKKAEVAIRLAAIRLLDGNPDGALRSLEVAQTTLDKVSNDAVLSTDGKIIAEKVDPEKQRQIYLLKARALSMKDKPDEALKILEPMALDPDVSKLRTDIAWDAAKWDAAAISLNDLIVAENISPKQELTDYQRDIILNRAIALNLSGDRVALDNLRERFDEQMKKSTKAQIFDVVTRPRRPDLIGSRDAIEQVISEIDLFKGFLDNYAKTSETKKP